MILIISLIGLTYMVIHLYTYQKTETISLIFGPLYYISFEITHSFSHSYNGSNNIILNAKHFHKLHHIDENTNYSFLTPFWDYMFGTLSPKYKVCFTELLLGFIPFYSFFIHKKSAF